MSKLKNLKINVPKIALEDYFWVVAGIPKSGKTSLFAKVSDKYFGGVEKSVLLAFEKGYQALKVQAIDIEDWDDFEDQVDELVENKEELGLQFIGIDTIDVMMDMATDAVIAEWNAANPSKRTKDIGGVGAKGTSNQGFGVGYQLVKKKVRTNVDKLMKAGYGIMALTHSKEKKTELKDGTSYDQLGLSLSSSASEIFVNMADFVLFVTIEKEKSGKSLNTNRYIYFRGNDYITAGSRFQNVPERIDYDVDLFLETFKTAVQSEFESGVDLDQIKKEQAEKREKAAQEFIESEKGKTPASELIEQLNTLVKPLSKVQKDKVTKEFKEILGGTANYLNVDDVALLEKCLAVVDEIVSE